MTTKPRILIMAGGTGGHVFPGLAVALKMRAEGYEVLWLGSKQGMEADIIPKASIPIRYLTIAGIRRQNFKLKILGFLNLFRAFWQALQIVYEYKPDVVLGMGGFVAGPGGVAAWILRRPLVIHEQNAVAGVTNRLLSRVAKRVLEGFPKSFPVSIKTYWTGNPVREELYSNPPTVKTPKTKPPLKLLVLGGSQGAKAINELLPKAVNKIFGSEIIQNNKDDDPPKASYPLEIWHQTGRGHEVLTQNLYKESVIPARIEPFIHDMAMAYRWADLVICRSGALTVAELAVMGVASILIPFPFAVDDHQTHNGRFLEKAGAAILLSQNECNAEKLADLIRGFLAEPQRVIKMGANALTVAKPQALQSVMSQCIEVSREFK